MHLFLGKVSVRTWVDLILDSYHYRIIVAHYHRSCYYYHYTPLAVIVIIVIIVGRNFRHYRNARRRDTSLCPTWCKRAFKSRHLTSRQSRHDTRNTTAGTGERTCARAACTVFSVAARLSPSRHPPALHPFLPSLALLRSNGRSPLARARPMYRGGVEEAPLAYLLTSRALLLFLYLILLRHSNTHAHSRESIIVQNRELSYYII